MLSVIIPARHEPYLQHTVDDLFENAQVEIEVVVVLDGYWPDPPLKNRKNLVIVHHGEVRGMRAAVNTGVRASKGKFILKCDAHCAFDKGFDKKLIKDIETYNQVLVPVRYSLDVNKWEPKLDKKYEFEYISSDDLKGKRWPEYAERVKGQKIVDLMTMQGSCWFMTRQWFDEIGGEDEVNYGQMGREAQEICLKTWLGGGRLMLTRNTWYAHWSKSKKDIRFSNRTEKEKSVAFATDFWMNDKWDKAVRPLSWLVEKFAPVPTWDVKKEDIMTPEKIIESSYKITELSENHRVIEGMTRAGMYRLFAKLGYRKGAEIGVQRGRNAWVMLQTIPDLSLILVDPYEDHPSNKRHWGERTHTKFKAMAANRLKDSNVEWIYGFSEEVSGKVKDGTLDFVYIDGEHTYDYVMLDIILWSRKVRSGGIVAGHDYEYKKPHQPKVAKAINDYATAYGMYPIYMTDKNARENPGDKMTSWFWIKG